MAKGGIRESRTFDSKADAVAWATKLESEILAGQRRSYSKVQKTLADTMDEYIKKISPSLGSHDWNKTRVIFMKTDMDFIGLLIRNVKPEQISGWRDKRLKAIAKSSVNRELNLLSSIFEAARAEWKWIHTNPVHDVKRPKNPKHRERRVPDAETEIMMRALGLTPTCAIETSAQYTAMAFLVALETGMRVGEIVATTWPHVHLKSRYVHVPKSKNGDARDVPLSSKAVALFERLTRDPDDSRCFRTALASVDRNWRERRDKLAERDHPEIADLHFHDSRHEATTRLSRKLDVLALAKMIGHRDIQSLMIYYNETATELAARLD